MPGARKGWVVGQKQYFCDQCKDEIDRGSIHWFQRNPCRTIRLHEQCKREREGQDRE